MIKILSGWTNRGGSTFAFINLTNHLNESGYDTTFYGPHEWHLDKCKSGVLDDNFAINSHDSVIVHFMDLNVRPKAKKVILSCHEKNIFEVGKMTQFWDEIVFINEKQRKYHSLYNGKYTTIPNIKEPLPKSKKNSNVLNIAGIIGSIDENKQTHVSIERALNDGYEKVMLFGNVTDEKYYNQYVKPLLCDIIVEYGFIADKSEMYDMIGAVYLSSKSEVASLVKDECETNGTKFFGNGATEHDYKDITNKEIIKEWVKVLDL